VNILIVISSLKIGGGAENVAYSLGSGLKELGHSVEYLTYYKYKKEYDVENKLCLNEKLNKNILSKFLKLFKRARFISKIYKKNNIDVVLSFMEESNFPTLLSSLFGNKSKKYVSVRQDVSNMSKQYQFLIKHLYSKADKVITVSKGIEYELRNNYNLDNIKTIYNPKDVSLMLSKSKEPISSSFNFFFSRPGFTFVSIGRFVTQKAHWYLLRSFKKTVEKYPESKLVLVGDGVFKSKIITLINNLGLQNNVLLTGLQDNVFPFLKNSDCFIMTSLWEGLPNTLLEALSMNLPIISTDCKTGPREILAPSLSINENISYPFYGNYGILINPFENKELWGDLEKTPLIKEELQLSNEMLKLIEDKNLRDKYSKGLNRVKDFDKMKIVKEYERVLNGLL